MKNTLYRIIHTRETASGRFFDLVIQSFIIISVAIHALETVKALNDYLNLLSIVENILLWVFVFEYFLRVYSAKKRLKFVFSFYGIVDVISIIPSILSHNLIDVRFLRVLRLLRVFRALKLVRYTKAMDRLKDAFSSIKEELIVFTLLTFISLYLSAAGIYFFENKAQPEVFSSIPASLWWAISTLTTVGYGDTYPITGGGKVFTTIILLLGLGVVSVPSALLASALSSRNS